MNYNRLEAIALLEKTPGMHRFTWDLRYPGPWLNAAHPQGPNGPVAVPGNYSVRLTAGSYTATQPLTFIEDPRVTADGVTTADLQEQFEHNMRTRDLVSEVNKMVARIRAAQKQVTGDKLTKLNALASRIITDPIRYSQPKLQTHITYLYSMTNSTDQKIGRDAIERYQTLRRELTQRQAELNSILGPEASPGQ